MRRLAPSPKRARLCGFRSFRAEKFLRPQRSFLLAERGGFNLIIYMKSYLLYVVGAACVAAESFVFADAPAKPAEFNPYGVCAHLSRWEFPFADDEMKLMKDAGIGGFRTDFDWGAIEKKNGTLDFSVWDALVEKSQKHGVEVLPIASGYVPERVRPFPRHPDEFAEFYAKAASRYEGKMKYWEVVNEPDHISFWGGLTPNPREYSVLLKKTYTAIKKQAPTTTVLYGGVSGVPFEYIETTLKEGCGGYFDIMNVHPYNWGGVQEGVLIPKIEKLRALMKKYGVGEKPIWITEFGYFSSDINPCLRSYINRAVEKLGVKVSETTICHIGDEKYNFYSDAFRGCVSRIFPNAKKYKRITFDKLKKLSPQKYPVLYIGGNEHFPYAYIEDLYNYVKEGGIAVHTGGIPFYYNAKIDKNQNLMRCGGDRNTMKIFRLASKTWSDADMQFVKPLLGNKRPYRQAILHKESGKGFEDIKPNGFYHGRLYLSDEAVAPEDSFEPFLYAKFGDKKIPVGATLKYGGDMKGAFVAIFSDGGENATEELQAKMLPREYLLARAAGVERVYKYSFRSNENNYMRESHFGIIHRNLDPKPAYVAYKTLTEMLGNAVPAYRQEGILNVATWKKSDGTPVCAVWTRMYPRKLKIKFDGAPTSARNYLGKPVKFKASDGTVSLNAGGGVVYIEGIENPVFVK